MRLLFILLFVTGRSLALAPLKQDYIFYNQKITEVSILVFRGDERLALQKFDSLFNAFDYIFAKDAYMGTQLAAKLGRDTLGFRYLSYCIIHGVPLALIRQDSLIHRLCGADPGRWQKTFKEYTNMRALYVKRINTPFRKTIDSLYRLDQSLTVKLNASILLRPYYWLAWNRRNKKDVDAILRMIGQCGYTGEQTAGLSTLDDMDTTHMHYGVNRFLGFHKTEFILIHYFTAKRSSLDEKLLPEVLAGRMTVYEYAVIHDFMARWGRKKYQSCYYNEWHQCPKGMESQVDSNRAALGLCSLQIKNEYNAYWKNISKNRLEHQAIYLPALM